MEIGIIGLGYVGLPLACLFAKKYQVICYDIDSNKIENFRKGIDINGEVDSISLKQKSLVFTTEINAISGCDLLIVAVPTGIDQNNKPDLEPIKSATSNIATVMKLGVTVVYESTVYPGLTEEVCVPILESCSGKVWKKDFFVGYSPERINPGDKSRPIEKIKKLIAGDTKETLDRISQIYSSVIEAGLYECPDIRTAEAAKVIENAQRDLNIAFVNELALIFGRMGIDTRDVLMAASTKWNFMPFEPGLVGGHCIGVDPYYLTFKSEQLGYSPHVIHSGRRVNNQMGKYIAESVVKALIASGKIIAKCCTLILGCTFKENITDTRNSKVFDIYEALKDFHIDVNMVDPLAQSQFSNRNIDLLKSIPKEKSYDAIILAVRHDLFQNLSLGYLQEISVNKSLFLFDIKAFYDKNEAIDISTFYWRL